MGADHTAAPIPEDESSDRAGDDRVVRRVIQRQALSIVLAVAPFGLVFGAAAARAGLTFWEAVGFSTLVFGGSSQFAAVEILGDGGSIASATLAGLFLNVRSLAFGIIMAPALGGAWWQRAAMSQLMIDESTVVGAAQTTRRWQRYGFLVTGIGVFVTWNLATVVGYRVFADAESLITDLGLDTAAPAAFLALLWPRLSSPGQRRTALAGAVIALILTPLVPPGIPILASMVGVLLARVPHVRDRTGS